MQQALWFPRCL